MKTHLEILRNVFKRDHEGGKIEIFLRSGSPEQGEWQGHYKWGAFVYSGADETGCKLKAYAVEDDMNLEFFHTKGISDNP